MPPGQQQAGAQRPQAPLGNPDLQKNLLDQLQGMLSLKTSTWNPVAQIRSSPSV